MSSSGWDPNAASSFPLSSTSSRHHHQHQQPPKSQSQSLSQQQQQRKQRSLQQPQQQSKHNSRSSTTSSRAYTSNAKNSNGNNSNNNGGDDSASSVISNTYSVTSTFRHNDPNSQFNPNNNNINNNNNNLVQHHDPQPVLTSDMNHTPKTRGSFGLLLVGIGGKIGTTVLGGILANRSNIHWRGPKGEPMKPNYNGCLTQLEPTTTIPSSSLSASASSTSSSASSSSTSSSTRPTTTGGGNGGFRGIVKGLADANMAAVGGWDICDTLPGDALLKGQILDYDLVRQIQDDMNRIKIFRGLYDPRFSTKSKNRHRHSSSSPSSSAATSYVLTEQEAKNDSEALKCLRADIRYFKWRNGVVGHTTVIWTANQEPNSILVEQIRTGEELLDCIELSEQDRGGPIPPSLLYATAALLEGCSFVNGTSQNTLSCPGLIDLANQQVGVYCLGSKFSIGLGTKFQTVTVDYLRANGLIPKVIAASSSSSSHFFSETDTRNHSSSSSTNHKKSNTKEGRSAVTKNDLDYQIQPFYTTTTTPLRNDDDQREFVEYTSLGFLGQPHTLVTYTHGSDSSILYAPLLIDVGVWCDFFASKSWPSERVTRALAYLFQFPNNGGDGVSVPARAVGTNNNNSVVMDTSSGFFQQMEELKAQVLQAGSNSKPSSGVSGGNGGGGGGSSSVSGGTTTTTTPIITTGSHRERNDKPRRVRIRPEEKTTEWAIPHDARIICAGLACVDMQLNNSTGGDGGEGIERFAGERSIGGGSVSMACKTMARLCHGAPLDDGYMEVTPPVVHSVIPLCKVGNDDTGTKLVSLLENCGQACRNVDTRIIKSSRKRDPNARTALAVLPIYRDGRRGCFFDAASNDTFSAKQMVEMMSSLSSGSTGPALDTSHMSYDDMESYRERLEAMTDTYGGFLFGYPHLLPKLQGEGLAQVLLEARMTMVEGGIIALDLNGVPAMDFSRKETLRHPQDLKNDAVIGPALEHVDILHMNQDELVLLTGCRLKGTEESELEDEFAIANAVNLFLWCGVSVVAVTRGKIGSYVACSSEDRFRRSPMLPTSWAGLTASIGAVNLPPATLINSNGAGDSFTSGLLVAAMLRHTGLAVPTSRSSETSMTSTNKSDDDDLHGVPATQPPPPKKKTLTPYTLYMRENYVSLKQQCKDDKKAIFSKCHEMWENESDQVKAMYERKAAEENERGVEDSNKNTEMGKRVMNDIEALDSNGGLMHSPSMKNSDAASASVKAKSYMTNQSLNLESAVQFATLVAAHHIDTKTRDLPHVDVSLLLERSMVYPAGIEEEI